MPLASTAVPYGRLNCANAPVPLAEPAVLVPARVLTVAPEKFVVVEYWNQASAEPPGLMLALNVAEPLRMAVAASVVADGALDCAEAEAAAKRRQRTLRAAVRTIPAHKRAAAKHGLAASRFVAVFMGMAAMPHWPIVLRLTFILKFHFELNLLKHAHYLVGRREQASGDETTN